MRARPPSGMAVMTVAARIEESQQQDLRASVPEPEKGGAHDPLKSQLKQADFAAGEALLAPSAPGDRTAGPTDAAPTVVAGQENAPPVPTVAPTATNEAGAPTTQAPANDAPAGGPKAITNEERQQLLKAKAADINKLEDLLSYGFFDLNVTEKEATKAIGLIEKAAQPARIVMIQELNRRGGAFVERLMSNLTGGARKAHPSAYLTLVVLSGQTAELEKLLKVKPSAAGFGPGAGDALAFAMSALPVDVLKSIGQDAVAGESATAWAAITPAPVGPQMSKQLQAARVEGAEVRAAKEERKAQEGALDAATKEAMAKDKDFAKTVDTIEDLLSYGAFDWAITDKEATKVFRLLGGLGDTQRVQMTVYQLDRGPFMDRFIDNVPGSVRASDKKTFLRIISARQPEKNIKYVQEIMSYGVFDWKITDEEGRLAFAVIKTMPKDVRETFRKKDGGKWWDRMEGNLSTEDAGDRDSNLYGDVGETQRLKLAFREECGTLGSTLLRQRIEMLLRMGEVDFVEESLLAAGLDQSETHAWIYAKYGFAGGGRSRNAKIFGAWMNNRIPSPEDASWWSGLASAFKALGMGASAAAHELFGAKGNAAAELDLMGLAELAGGNIAGMTFAEREDDKDNRIAVDMQLASGRVQVSSPKLAIAAINRFSGGVQLETGPVTVSGLHFDVKWPTKDDPSTYFHVKVDGVEANGIWQITEDQMTTVDRLTIAGFEMRGERAVGELPPDTATALSTLMAEMSDTFTGLMGAVRVDSADAQAISSHLGASMLGGMPAKVTLGSLGVEGYATSDGGSVAEASVRDLAAEMKHQQLGEGLRAEVATLEALPQRDEGQEGRLATLRAELDRLKPLEDRAAELMAKQADPKTPLEPWEREELKGLRDQLTVMSTELSVGTVTAKEIRTEKQAVGSLEATDLKASATAQRPGVDGKAGLESGYQAEAAFSAGSVKLTALENKGSNRLDAYKARLDELKARIGRGLADDAEVAQYETLFAEVRVVETQIVERDALLLKEQPSKEEAARLEELSTLLAPWVTLSGASRVGSMELQGVEGAVDAQSGQVSVKAGGVSATDIEAEGLKVDALKIAGAEATVDLKGSVGGAMAAGDARNASFIDQVSQGAVKAESVEMQGLDMQGKKPSIALREKLESMQQQLKLRPGSLSGPEMKLLAELPGQVNRAEVDEARMEELRALRKTEPEAFNAGLVAELNMLEKKCEATWLSVATFQAQQVEAGIDVDKGTVHFNAGGDGKAGVTATGIKSGHVVDGEHVLENRIDAVSVGELGVDVAGKDGRLPDGLAMSQGSQGFELGVKANDIEVHGMQKGEVGAVGSSSLEKARIGNIDATMDSEKDGGRLDAKVLDAEIVGLKSKAMSILDAAYADILKFEDILAAGGTLSAKQQEHLGRARNIVNEAAALQGQIDAAKTKAEKDKLQKRLETWIATNDISVGHASVTDVELGMSGIGNPLNAGSNIGNAPLNVDARIHGEAKVTDLKAGDASVKSATVRDVDAKLGDVNSDENRTIDGSIGSFDVKGAKMPGTSVGSASGKGITVDGQGRNMQVGADHLGASNVRTGSTSVARVDATTVKAGVTDLGGKNQTVTGSVGGVSVAGAKHTSRTSDGTTTATVGKLKGRRGSFAMKPGGRVSGNLGSFSGSDIGVVSKDKAGTTTLDAKVGTVEGSGVGFSNGPRGMHASVANIEAGNITASGTQLDGRTVEVGRVTVNGVDAGLGKDGSFSTSVKSVGVENIRADDGQGRMSSVEAVNVEGLKAQGNLQDKVLTSAGVGSLEVRNVSLQEDGVSATLDLAVVNDVRLHHVDFSDPKAMKGDVSVGGGEVRGLNGSVTDKKTGGVTSAQVDVAGFSDLKGRVSGDEVSAGVGHAYVRGANVTSDVIDKETGLKTGQRHAGVESLDVKGVSGQANTATGDYAADVKKVDVKGVGARETDLAGNERMKANVDAVGLDHIKAGGNYQQGEHVASVHETNVTGVGYEGIGPDGVKRTASVESLNINGLKGEAGQNGNVGVGFRDVTVKGVDYEQGEKGQVGYAHMQSDKLKAGNGRDMSSILMKPDGTFDGSVKAIEVGPGTRATWIAKDEKSGEAVTHNAGLKAPGEKGGLNVGEIRMKDFNPGDLSSDKSQLQVFDIDAHSFVYNGGNNTIVGRGAHLDAVFVKGAGDGRVMGGYSGMELDGVHANMDLPDGGRAKVDATGVRSEGGYALVDGFKEGQEFGLAYAHLKSLEGDHIQADIKVPPPKTGIEAYLEAQRKYEKDLALWREGKGPKPQRVNLEGLQHTNGTVGGSYTYNQDDDNVWDSIGAAFTGRSVEGDVNIKNGSVDMRTLDAGAGEFSLLGGAADIVILQPFLAGVRTGAAIDGVVRESGGLISAEDLANLPANKHDMMVAMYRDHRRAYEALFGKEPPGKPDAPEFSNYVPGVIESKRQDLSRIEAHASLRDMGGGTIGAGGVEGQMNRGGELDAKGNLGEHMNVEVRKIGFTDVTAAGGNVTVGEAGLDKAVVNVYNAKDPNDTRVTVDVSGTKVAGVEVKGAGVDKQKAEDDFERMTNKGKK
jgi:hypothetical protein